MCNTSTMSPAATNVYYYFHFTGGEKDTESCLPKFLSMPNWWIA